VVQTAPLAASEAAAQDDARRFKVVSIVALVVSIPFVISHAVLGFAANNVAAMFRDMGGPLPGVTQVVMTLAQIGILPVLLLVVDVGVFLLMRRLAQRYWIGLLFVPPLAYQAISASFIPVLYLPLFEVITLVQ